MLIGRNRDLFFLIFFSSRDKITHSSKGDNCLYMLENSPVISRFSRGFRLTETLNERVVLKAGMLETWNSETKALNPKTRIDYICVACLFQS